MRKFERISRKNIFGHESFDEINQKLPSFLIFFKKCPHFFDNTCSSINWGCDSPCHKCFKDGKYNPKNAENIEIKNKEVSLFVNVKDEKCR